MTWSVFRQYIKDKTVISIWLCLLFGLFGIIGWCAMFLGRDYTFLTQSTSPWMAIPTSYIYFFFGATLVAGLLIIWSNLKTGWLLLILILHSFLLHAYLPLSNQLIYGADGWRHAATVLAFLNTGKWWSVAPSSLIIYLGFVSYAAFWYVLVFLVRFLQVDILFVIRWLLPVIWPIGSVLLGFKFGKIFGLSRRLALLFVWLLSLPFALQAAGAFTLPVNFWFLPWLGASIILFKYLNGDAKINRRHLFLLLIFLALGYSLYPVIFLISWLVGEILKNGNFAVGIINKKNILLASSGAVSSVFIITVLELFSGYSYWPNKIAFFSGVKQFLGNLTGWYLAAGPRPHDITTGNILFNQTSAYAFVPNIFTVWHDWIFIFLLLFWAGICFGFIRLYKSGLAGATMTVLFKGLFLAYFVGRYILVGEQLFTRRLESVLALFCVMLFTLGVLNFIEYQEKNRKKIMPWMIGFTVVMSVAIAASYSLGPDTQSVSVLEHNAMKMVAKDLVNNATPCVIAGTYPLLALEELTFGRVAGGGFLFEANFGQEERVKLWENLRHGLDVDSQSSVQLLQDKRICWFVGTVGEANNADRILKKIFLQEYRPFEYYDGVVARKYYN